MLLQLLESASLLAGTSSSAEVMAEVRQRFAIELDARTAADLETVRNSIGRTLPAGVGIEHLTRERMGSVVESSLFLALDDLRKLPVIRVAFEPGLVRQTPFAEIAIIDEGDAIVVEGMPPSLELSPELVGAKGVSAHTISFVLEVPRPVLETSGAEMKAKDALSWTFDLGHLAARTSADRAWIRVKYAKVA